MYSTAAWTTRIAIPIVILILCPSTRAQPIRTVTSFPKGQPLPYLGNGILGYRVMPNPFMSWKGVASGFVKDHEEGGWETLAYGPYPFAMDFKLGDTPSMRAGKGGVKVERQTLDMSCGELTTTLAFPLGGGVARAKVRQFISRTMPVVSAQEVRLTVPAAGELEITAQVVSGPGNEIYSGTPPHHEKVTDVMVGYACPDRRSRCGVSVKLDFGQAEVVRHEFEPGKPETARRFTVNVIAGQTLVIRTLAAAVTSAYHPEPHLESCRLVNMADAIGFEKLRNLNRQAWGEIWKSRIRITGDDEAQEYLDWCLFYTFSSVHPSCRTSMPPFGTSQVQNYFGHVFWDTDTYTTPALLLISPEAAKMTIDYRRRNLEAAKKRAQTYGFKGAMYPWESGTRGEEATPSTVSTGWLQQHVNMCVAVAAWQYQLAAGDEEHARTCTWPIVKAVAEWVMSRVERTERGYEIRDTMSSHEGMMIQNSCYVNAIAAEALRIAAACAEMLGHPPDARWKKIAEKMFIPMGPAPEDSGIAGDIIYMHEAGWVEEGASVDMFMLGFPFDLPFDRDLLRRTYAFYKTLPTDTLSMGAVFMIGEGAFVGDRQWQRELLHRVITEKCDPVWGMGTEYTGDKTTCFVTTQAGMLQTVLTAMTGIRFEPGNWTKYEACLPEGWSRIEVDRVYLGGQAYRLEAVHGKKAVLTPVE